MFSSELLMHLNYCAMTYTGALLYCSVVLNNVTDSCLAITSVGVMIPL